MSDTNNTSPSDAPPAVKSAEAAVPAELHGLAEHAHPLARRDFYTLMDRSEADLRCVLLALDSRLGLKATTDKQEQAYFTVKCFVDAHGHFPQARELERWLNADPVRKRILLSESAIRKAFGGKWAAVEASWVGGTVEIDVTARRLTAVGPGFSEEELLAVGRAFLAAMPPTGPLLRADLERFLDLHREKNTTGLPRVPRNYGPFRREFGSGFKNVLVALGQEHRSRYAMSPVAAFPGECSEPRFKGVRFRAADDGRLEGVRAAAGRFGALLSYPQYNAFRAEAILAAEERGDQPPPWPHSRTLVDRYGSWPGVKLAADVFTEADVASGAQRNVFSDEELVAELARALISCGASLTASSYRVWRVRRKEQLAGENLPHRVPRARLLSRRLGGPQHRFTAAIALVLERRPDVAAQLRARGF